MFYSFLRYVVAGLIWLINGHSQTQEKQELPDGPFVLVAPHRYVARSGFPRTSRLAAPFFIYG